MIKGVVRYYEEAELSCLGAGLYHMAVALKDQQREGLWEGLQPLQTNQRVEV